MDTFKNKLADYGSEDGHKYDFFDAIESFQTIRIDKKIGQSLKEVFMISRPIGIRSNTSSRSFKQGKLDLIKQSGFNAVELSFNYESVGSIYVNICRSRSLS